MKVMTEIYEWVHSIVIGVALAMLLNIFVFQPTRVMGSSMEPTLQENNYLFVSKLSHTLRLEPAYGDIVIIDSRVHRHRTWKDDITEPALVYLSIAKMVPDSRAVWVKRVIGKPGDTLTFREGKVIRNGTQLEETYLAEETSFPKEAEYVVPENHVFVMGDNRNHSSDSRIIGSVPVDHVLGKVMMKL